MCGFVCEVVQKYHEMFFIYNYSHFQYSFCNQPVLFAQLENVNKLWNNNRTVHVNERNQTKTTAKIKSRHIQIDHEFYLFLFIFIYLIIIYSRIKKQNLKS